jgi:hypothetical protein
MPPPKPPIWFDANILIDIQDGKKPRATTAEKSASEAFEAGITNLQKDGHDLLLPPRAKFEFLRGPQDQAGQDLLNSLGIKEDGMVTQIPRQQVWGWGEEGRNSGLSAPDADVIAQVRAGAQARGVNNPVFLTRDAGGTLVAMRRRGVMAVEYTPSLARTQIPANPPAPRPEPVPTPPTPVPTPRIGSVGEEGLAGAAKAGFKAGLKGLYSAETIVGVAADLLLIYADKVAAREAIRTIQIKFMKEGFAKGVAAGVMGWTEQEVKSTLMNRVTNFRVQGLADPAGTLTTSFILQLAERIENYAVLVGFRFSSSKTLQWKQDIRAKGYQVLQKYGYYFGTDPAALFEYNFIDKLASVLRPTTDSMVETAIRFN